MAHFAALVNIQTVVENEILTLVAIEAGQAVSYKLKACSICIFLVANQYKHLFDSVSTLTRQITSGTK